MESCRWTILDIEEKTNTLVAAYVTWPVWRHVYVSTPIYEDAFQEEFLCSCMAHVAEHGVGEGGGNAFT